MLDQLQSLPVAGDEREQWFAEQFARHMHQWEQARTPSLSIMVTKGTLDGAYPPFIVGSTASALGWEVTMFFTFYGLTLLKKKLDLRVSGLGNPAMPMKMPFGPSWFRGVEWQIPNLIMAGVPGFEWLATGLMGKTLRDKGVAPIAELRTLCVEGGVRLVGCQMTRDLFGWAEEDFIQDVTEWAGAASYLAVARGCGVNLYM